jgi:hypothetical protein
MNDVALRCHECGTAAKLVPGTKIARTETCPKCDADLHCCRNCRFFDPGRHNQCAETQAEWVQEKARANFCDHFERRTGIDLVQRTGAGAENARERFDSLFRKP